ncbi:hypothetical protein IEE94_08850 [Yimella sp. cx-573]|nr:hypothetical protein [Yimella sp. cx-573]
METNENSYDPTAALDDVRRTRSSLSDRATAPWYYYPVHGLCTAAIVGSTALVESSIVRIGLIVLAAMVLGALVAAYQKATGLWVVYGTSTGRSKVIWTTYGLFILALVGGAFAVQAWGPTWLGWVLTAAAFISSIICGRFIEPALRQDIADGRTSPKAK